MNNNQVTPARPPEPHREGVTPVEGVSGADIAREKRRWLKQSYEARKRERDLRSFFERSPGT